MPNLASFCFKPKHGPDIAKKIVEHFCNKFLGFDHEGFYLYWRPHDASVKHRPVPEGWLEFYIDTDNGNIEAYSEVCFLEEEVDGVDLTENFFALLGEDFWDEDEDTGAPVYSMYERELFEVVTTLSADGSRTIAWGADRSAYISYDRESSGDRVSKQIDLLEYAMTVPLDGEKREDKQLTLPLA